MDAQAAGAGPATSPARFANRSTAVKICAVYAALGVGCIALFACCHPAWHTGHGLEAIALAVAFVMASTVLLGFALDHHFRLLRSAARLSEEREVLRAKAAEAAARKAAEQALAEEVARRRMFVDGSRDGIVVIDMEGRAVEANPRFASVLGYTLDEVLKMHVWDWDRDWSRDSVLASLAGLGREGVRFETRHTRKDGTTLSVEIANSMAEVGGRKLVFCVCRDITERKHTEAVLRENLFFRREAERIAKMGAWKVNVSAGSLYWTEGVYDILRAPSDYRPSLEDGLRFYDEESIPALRAALAAAATHGTPFLLESGLTTMDGRHIWTEVRGIGRVEEDGQAYVIGTFHDITARREQEAYTRLHLETLQLLAKDAPLVEVLESVVRLLESRNRDWIGSILMVTEDGAHLSCAAAPKMPEFFRQAVARVPIREGIGSCGTAVATRQKFYVEDVMTHPYWEEFRGLARDAGVRSCWSNPILSAQGEVLGALAVYRAKPALPGVAEIQAMDEVLNLAGLAIRKLRAEEALREREERFRDLVETSYDWIWEMDAEGRYTYASPRVARLLGHPPEEILGKTPFDLMPEAEAARARPVFAEILAARRPFTALERTHRHKDGRPVVLESSGAPVLGADGRLLGYRGMDRDVSERLRLEAQLRQAQKLEAVGQLAGGVAHDFNNILAAGMMHLGLLEMNQSLDAKTRAALKDLDRGMQRAATLTRQLLMFSRRSHLSVQPLDLDEVVANLLKMLGRIIGENIELRFQPRGRLPAVEADAGMLEQVVLNLVVNARDAMPLGGAITIDIEARDFASADPAAHPERRAGRFVRLSVADNGTGIDAETLKHIFEPFFTTKEVGKGSGLGLATVHGIVAQHKGWVEVETEPGRGSVFHVLLPALDASPVAAPARAEERPAVPGGRECVLVVEDDDSLREMVMVSLQLLGYEVHGAANGPAGVERWEALQGRVDLLLTDMVMTAGMNGMELIEKLREKNPRLPAIIASGYSSDMVKSGVPTLAGVRYLPKPFAIAALAELVRKSLSGE